LAKIQSAHVKIIKPKILASPAATAPPPQLHPALSEPLSVLGPLQPTPGQGIHILLYVVGNLYNQYMQNSIILEWVHGAPEPECSVHRVQMLGKVLVSMIHLLIRDRKRSFRVVKSSTSRLGLLRYQ